MNQLETQTEITLKQIEEPTNPWSFIMAGGLLGKRRRERQRLAHPEGLPVTQPIAKGSAISLNDVICPGCGSPEWRMTIGGIGLFIFGIMAAGIGILLSITVILAIFGIPLALIGFVSMIASPFIRRGYKCTRCEQVWKL